MMSWVMFRRLRPLLSKPSVHRPLRQLHVLQHQQYLLVQPNLLRQLPHLRHQSLQQHPRRQRLRLLLHLLPLLHRHLRLSHHNQRHLRWVLLLVRQQHLNHPSQSPASYHNRLHHFLANGQLVSANESFILSKILRQRRT